VDDPLSTLALQVASLGGTVGAFENDGIAARFEEWKDLLAIGDPGSTESRAHSPTHSSTIAVSWAAVRAREIGQSLPLHRFDDALTIAARDRYDEIRCLCGSFWLPISCGPQRCEGYRFFRTGLCVGLIARDTGGA
jgi:hypothetical protein